MFIEAVSTIINFVVIGDGRSRWEFVIDGRLGKDSVMEALSKISNFVITGGGILGWEFVIDWILGKVLVVEAVGKDVSEGDFKRTDHGTSVVGGTHLGNVKQSDDGLSTVVSTRRDMSYAEVVSKR